MENAKMKDDVFQQKVLLDLQYMRGEIGGLRSDVGELRSEFTDFRSEMRAQLSFLRKTTAEGFESLTRAMEILRTRVDRIERYLGL